MIGTVLTWIVDTLLSPLFWFWDQAGIIPWVIGGFILALVLRMLGASRNLIESHGYSNHTNKTDDN